MGSKVGIDLQKETESVLAIAEAHGTTLGKSLDQLMRKDIPEKAKLDWDIVIHTLTNGLRSDLQTMQTKIQEYEREMSDDEAPRAARDEATKQLYDVLVSVRDSVGGVYGISTVRLLGFSGPTPQDPVALKELGTTVHDAIGKVKLPKPKLQGAQIDLTEVKEKISEPLKDLTKSLKDVAREAREAQGAISAKNKAIGSLNSRLSATISILEGLFSLADMPDLADRVRPNSSSSKSNSKTDEDPDSSKPIGDTNPQPQ